MACEDLEEQLASLQRQRDDVVAKLNNLGAGGNPGNRFQLLLELRQINIQISAAKVGLDACLKSVTGTPAAPQHILELRHINPEFHPTDPYWAAKLAGGEFPVHSGFEWKQVLAPDEEYDQFSLVGASGWVINNGPSPADFPFNHPFGGDWEFWLAPDASFTGLLAPGNSGPDSDIVNSIVRANALGISVPQGVLGVEWDSSLVPESFQNEVHEGDRVATLGRWIVDCGHADFHTEIHPPLLMAVANPRREADGTEGTRVVFTSRPYLPGQTYAVDTENVYDDSTDDDGAFYDHILKEVLKVNAHLSFLVEAHPKIKSHPFLGAHLAHFIIRPPDLGRFHNPVVAPPTLGVSFHFTVRSGCAVQVISSAPDTIDVFIAMSHAGYIPPPLPNRQGRRVSREELSRLSDDAGNAYLAVDALSSAAQLLLPGGVLSSLIVALLLARGIETDQYASLPAVNVLDTRNAVMNAPASAIPSGLGVTQDDGQPFPVFGWLDVKPIPPVFHP